MFHPVSKCRLQGRENQSVVSDLDGTLVKSTSSFPYFMLMAFEAGSPLRALLLLLVSPVTWIFYRFISEAAGLHLLIFVSLVGLKAADVSMVGRAVLPKFYLEDLHPLAYKVFVSCGKRYVVTANPRMMVEPFLKEYLKVDGVLGTELQVIKGFCTGLVAPPGVLLGWRKHHAVKALFGDDKPDVALGNRPSDFPFMFLCKEAYVVPVDKKVGTVGREEYLKPLVFHDGRLAIRPTPLVALGIFLWFPVGVLLALARLCAGICLPYGMALPMVTLLGVRIRVKGVPPLHTGNTGILYVCSHRTLLDPIFLTTALGKPVAAVTYSISRMSEILSPIKTVRLTRNRARDGQMMSRLLKEGDLVVCPEGTTCREPYLLRFSSLFAELTDFIVPVTMDAQVTLFHGTTARGWKCLDPLFFLMNPSPCYHIAFLDKLPKEMSCSAGKSSFEVANHIQKTLADALGFQCTNFTRKDKYTMLAGNQGLVPDNAYF
ncbi:hypothetical protein SUGI_1152970 [Cryptomeria japonica]|uniref:glycerol-3-phosphate acyltransferase RAM2 n=1 Tax=Cryptomeria japonica TaxID=3369 RepID=UPI0024148872|nr:glycerol-3-phosphate acyltransferase RAM2 [Cryptomeria japonica]GLJ53947.1 hypothetical protein SUGI_1152970 [Cryptomeria japonica]